MAAVEHELTEAEVEALDAEEKRETIAEVVARESEPDDEPTTEPEPEPAPEPTPESSATVAADRDKKLTSEATRHENALKKIYGDDFAARAYCPCCLGEGFLEPWPQGAMPEEIWEAVQVLTGHVDSDALPVPDYFLLCDNCQGFGEVATPGRGGGVRKVPCKRCDSRGWFDTEDPVQRTRAGLAPAPVEAPPPVVWAVPTPAPTAQQEAPAPPGWYEGPKLGADQWGRWPGHPRFGIDPALNNGVW